MLDRGHHLTLRGAVAGELVRDHDTRGPALLFQQLAKQTLGGLLVPPALDQDVEHNPILVDGPPEPVLLAADHQAHFVEMPFIARTGQPAPDLVGERLAELEAPLAHSLVAHVDAAGGQHLFDHAQAQRKAEVQPHGVADDLARKAIAGVGGLGCGCHARHLPVPAFPAKPRPKLTVPTTALAPRMSKRRMVRSPIFEIAPSLCLPPVDVCRGVSPSQAAKSRPARQPSRARTRAVMAVAAIGPMPGIVISRRATGSAFARWVISASNVWICASKAWKVPTNTVRTARALSGTAESGSSTWAITASACVMPWGKT